LDGDGGTLTDLDRMARGLLDPRGRTETHAAFARAGVALLRGMAALLLCPLLWLVCVFVLDSNGVRVAL
jgi:hypothetical protein